MSAFQFLLVLVVGSLVRWSTGGYVHIYGGIVAQTVQNASESDRDVSDAVAFAVGQAKLRGEKCSVTNMEKQRLYYSTDGLSPLLHKKIHESQTTATSSRRGNRPSFQRTQLVLGITYSFLLHCPSKLLPHKVKEEYHFVVTCDRNKQYHVFRHTSRILDQLPKPPQCRNVSTFHDVVSSSSHILASNPLTCSANFSQVSLRIASFNIWNVNKVDRRGETYQSRMQRLSKLINSLDVDIFGFQEVRLEVGSKIKQKKKGKRKKQSVPTRSQMTDLASQLQRYQFVFQPAMLYMEKLLERKEEGLAIFSLYPIISSDYRLLSRNSSDVADVHQRICLHAEVLTPQFGIVHVFVSHLSLSNSSQERSAVEIWKYMEEFSGIKLLMGDLNAEPPSTTIRFLAGEVPLDGVRTRDLSDLWQLQESRRTRTSKENNGLTFSALDKTPVKRIDYIFGSFPSTLNVGVDTTGVTIDNHICFLPCSDHHILWTVLTSQRTC